MQRKWLWRVMTLALAVLGLLLAFSWMAHTTAAAQIVTVYKTPT